MEKAQKKDFGIEDEQQVAFRIARIMSEYNFRKDSLTVKDPGKFEGEHISSLYFHEEVLNGGGEDFGQYSILDVLEPERVMFGFNGTVEKFALFFRDDGFVEGFTITKEEYDELVQDLEEEEIY